MFAILSLTTEGNQRWFWLVLAEGGVRSLLLKRRLPEDQAVLEHELLPKLFLQWASVELSDVPGAVPGFMSS